MSKKSNAYIFFVMEKKVIVKKGVEKKIKNYYLWIYRDEIRKISGNPKDGEIISVYDHNNNFLAKGSFNGNSHIPVRIFFYDQDEQLDKATIKRKINDALTIRKSIKNTNSIRIINSESDAFPGLILDRYGSHFVIQSRIKTIDLIKSVLIDVINDVFSPLSIYERSEGDFRKEEKLEPIDGELYLKTPDRVLITERNSSFIVDVKKGAKTGFYMDQRDNRFFFENLIEEGNTVLDLFSYTGAFSVFSAKKGATVTMVEIEPEYVEIAKENARINKVENKIEFVTKNAYDFLEDVSRSGKKFDFIVIDPPGIIKSKGEVEKGKWAYWKLAYNSFLSLKKGGKCLISSCSYHVSPSILLEMIRLASSDSGRRIRIITQTYQPEDHPWILQIPETLYLKSFFLEALN
ncbi:MAG: class I SAM-dependent rRNA methyltransferase [Acidobacteriota bacterium]